MKRVLIFCTAFGVCINIANAQFGTCDCSATVGGFSSQTSVNFSSISWTGTGCPTSGSTSYTGNLCLTLGSKTTIVFDKSNYTVTGNFNVQNTGTSTIFSVPSGDGLHVTGNFGDPTNNTMDFVVNGTLKVDGTFYGKNSNAFSGSGSISGGTLSLGNSGTCGTPCPVSGGFTNCYSDGSSINGAGAFCQSSGALPVTLIYFKGSNQDGKVLLNWSTASELNFDYFSLQRSGDGTAFNEIAQVKGHGTTNVQQNYKYEDNFPLIGKNYYRLTSVDFDNYRETFKTILVDYSGEKEFHVLPNPSDGSQIKLNFNFDIGSDGHVTIYDNLGSVVGYYPAAANGTITFENHLKNGIYLAKYSSAQFTKTDRFLVK